MDWLQFEFDYRLDLPRLTPHLLAIEAHKQERSLAVAAAMRESSLMQGAEKEQTSKCNWTCATRPTPGHGSMRALRCSATAGTHRPAHHAQEVTDEHGRIRPGVLRSLPCKWGREVGGLHMARLPTDCTADGRIHCLITSDRLRSLHR